MVAAASAEVLGVEASDGVEAVAAAARDIMVVLRDRYEPSWAARVAVVIA